jgi:hypothetical protein
MAARILRRDLVAILGSVGAGLALGPTSASSAARAAHAPGRVHLTRRAIDENDGAWRLLATIHLGAPPPSAKLPVRFSFAQHVDFERTEGDAGTQERRRPLRPPRVLVEAKDVDFGDTTGGVGRDGRADLALRREKQFRAGEYRLEVLGPDGRIGTPVELVLRGTNPAPP